MTDSLMLLADDFIKYKHSNGYVYVTAEYSLKKYVSFSSVTAPEEVIPSKATVNAFLDLSNKTLGSLYNIASVLREFCRYLFSIGYGDAYIVPLKKVHLPPPVQPYLFTVEEIEAFFRQCDGISINPYYKTRHIVLPAMYRLLYCCGLRCKEVRILPTENVCLDCNYIDVLQSKGPMH
jgi:integrase/recombinase XerD